MNHCCTIFPKNSARPSRPVTRKKQSLLAELMDSAACRTLEEIREVLDDERLDDQNCFQRIEEIVRLYEKLGSNGGSRHDF